MLTFCLLATVLKAGDWSEWFHKTPGNNTLSNENLNDRHRNVFTCSQNNQVSLQFLEKWYFYKGNIIGTFEDSQPKKFFIVNENSCAIDSFSNNSEFDQVLRERKLKPIIWERWFNDNWGFFFEGEGDGGLMDWFYMRGTWLILPCVLFLALGLILNKIKNKYGRLISIGIVIITAVRILLDVFSMSI